MDLQSLHLNFRSNKYRANFRNRWYIFFQRAHSYPCLQVVYENFSWQDISINNFFLKSIWQTRVYRFYGCDLIKIPPVTCADETHWSIAAIPLITKDPFLLNPILFGVSGVVYFIWGMEGGGKNALPLYFLNQKQYDNETWHTLRPFYVK